jgi:hypothetical protein
LLTDVLDARFFSAQDTVMVDGEVEDETMWASDFGCHCLPLNLADAFNVH